MIYRWHGYGVDGDAMVVARPNENTYLFLPGQLVGYLKFSLRDNNNTNGFQFSNYLFIVVMNNLVY